MRSLSARGREPRPSRAARWRVGGQRRQCGRTRRQLTVLAGLRGSAGLSADGLSAGDRVNREWACKAAPVPLSHHLKNKPAPTPRSGDTARGTAE